MIAQIMDLILRSADGLPLAAILVPMIGALLCFLVSRRLAVLLTVPLCAGIAAALLIATASAGPIRLALGGWGAPLGIGLRADGTAAVFLAMTAAVMVGVALYAAGDPSLGNTDTKEGQRQRSLFWTLTFLLWAGLAAAFLTHDLFNMYVALELTSLSGIALVALARGPAPLLAQMRYLIQATFGSLLFLMGVVLIYGLAGVLDMGLAAPALTPSVPAGAAAVLITVGLMMKSAIWPVHAWLPPAHGAAPPAVSAMLSALVVKASLYLLMRIWAETFPALATPVLLSALGAFGAAAILWGSAMALLQERLKLMIAYSTVAQLGYALIAFPLAAISGLGASLAWSAGLLHLVSHGLSKGALFLAAGTLAARLGGDTRNKVRGAARVCPVSVFVLGLAGLSIMALPPSGGFLAKWFLLKTALDTEQWIFAAVLVAGGLMAAAYLMRFLLAVFEPAPASAPGPVTGPAAPGQIRAFAALFLALASLVLGLASSPVFDLFAQGSPDGLMTPGEGP